LQRGTRFLGQLEQARASRRSGVTLDSVTQTARAFIAAHRSHRDPRTLTRFAHGDAPQPSNSTAFSGGVRYGQDVGSALRGLSAVQRRNPDPELLQAIADFAESSLLSLTPAGA